MYMKHIALWLLFCAITIKAKIIIIGAGSAGIAAATKLLENNITDILLLEAEDRIGGRIHTIDFGENVQDLGAQTCHGEIKNVVFELANPLGLIEHSYLTYENVTYVNAKGELLPRETMDKLLFEFEDLYEVDDNSTFNGTFAEYFTERYNEFVEKEFKDLDPEIKDGMLHVFHLQVKLWEGCDSWNELTIKAEQNYDASEGYPLISWKKGFGFKTIFDVMMKKIPDPSKALPLEDKILLNKEVVSIDWNDEPVVKCKDGSEYKAERIILTPSLGVLKAQYETLFKPPLPNSKIDAIKGLNYGIVEKLIFEFSSPWWGPDTECFYIILSELNNSPELRKLFEEHDWLKEISIFQLFDYQPNMLTGWIASEAALKMQNLDEDLVRDKLMEFMRLLLGKQYNIPDPVNFIRTQWGIDPRFRGSYSYNSVKTEELHTSNSALAEPLKNSNDVEVLLFAGEATHPNRYASVHGAIETGWREADRLIKQM